MKHALGSLVLVLSPAFAQEQDIQRALIQRQQQSDAFTLQLRQSQELLKVPAARRQAIESRQLVDRQQLDNVSETQLQEVKPDTPQELRPYERQRVEEERRALVSP